MKMSFLKALLLTLALPVGMSARAQSMNSAHEPISATVPDLPIAAGGLHILQLREADRLALVAPAKGRLVFQTDGAQPGFWFNAGTRSAPVRTFLNASIRTAGTPPKPAGS